VRVRCFDVATFVAFGGAQLGICGSDVLMEFDYPEIYAPLDLGIGACRVSVAEPVATALGGHGELVERAEDLAPAIERALASGKPSVVNVMIESIPSPVVRR
jgi:ATP phosphoribosyltransferase